MNKDFFRRRNKTKKYKLFTSNASKRVVDGHEKQPKEEKDPVERKIITKMMNQNEWYQH